MNKKQTNRKIEDFYVDGMSGVKQNLIDAGCTEGQIKEFIDCLETDATCQSSQRVILKQREEILKDIHEKQRCLDCLDYLAYNMTKVAGH